MRLCKIGTLGLGALLPAAALAQVIELDEITAVANLEDIELRRSGSSVSVLDEEQIEALGETRATDVLARLPGVEITTTGPVGTRTGMTLRGASQNYVSVIVDGIEVTDPSGTQVSFDFGSLTTMDISRIEVLKGSQSAIYGSEPIGGVIEITTRRASEIGTEQSASLEYGTFNSLRASYGLANKGEQHELAFTASHFSTDGFSAADENQGNFETDPYDAQRLSFYGHGDLGNGARIGISGYADRSRGDFDEFGGAGGDGTPGDEYNDNNSQGVRLFSEFSSTGVEHKLDATWTDSHRESFFNGSPAIFDGERRKVAYLGATDLSAASRLAFGADWTEEAASDNFGFSANNRTVGVFGELTHSLSERIDITLAVRHDDHSEFGGHSTGRLVGSYRPRDDINLRASIGSGFRAPSLYELYSGFGDQTLQPERSLSADFGIEKTFGENAYLRATAFALRVDELIDFDFNSTNCSFGALLWGCYAQVSGESRRDGIELQTGMAIGAGARIEASYTYTDSSTSASSSWAAVPKHSATLTAKADLAEQLTANLGIRFAGDRQNGLPDYTLADAALNWGLNDRTKAWIRVENIFDIEYQTVPGYGTSDRAFYVGVSRSF